MNYPNEISPKVIAKLEEMAKEIGRSVEVEDIEALRKANRRQYRAYGIPSDFISRLLKGEYFRFSSLPEDVKFVRASYEAKSDLIVMLLSSSEFDEVAFDEELFVRALNIIGASDIEDQKNRAYAERNKLVAALSKMLPSHLTRHPDNEPWENDWRWVVCIHNPYGQMTWHIHDSELPQFNHLLKGVELSATCYPIQINTMVENCSGYDGHTTEEKYKRLENML